MTMSGAQMGILQGERRWRELATMYALAGVPRLVIGLALILWRPTEFMAFLGVALGYYAPLPVRPRVLRHGRASRVRRTNVTGSCRSSRKPSSTRRRCSPTSR